MSIPIEEIRPGWYWVKDRSEKIKIVCVEGEAPFMRIFNAAFDSHESWDHQFRFLQKACCTYTDLPKEDE